MLNIMKAKSFRITAALLALTLTVSCIAWNTTRVHAQELTIDNTNVQTFAGARAITNDELVGTENNPATMSVFVTGSGEKYNATNMRWEHKGDGWQSSGAATVYFAGGNSEQQIYACSPYAENIVDGTKVNVIADGKTDWLVATSQSLTSNQVNLTMTHALSKLVIRPTFGTEVTNRTITSINVEGIYASGNLNIADNTWSDLSATAILEMENNELLVIPMEDCASFDVVITMEDGRRFTTTVDLTGVGSKLAAGTQYNIALQVGQDRVTLGGITAEDWTQKPGGSLETE